jgi:multiple sugar transport system substrate-binding protein
MRRQVIVLAAALAMAPLGSQAADLVVWWEQGFYPQEDEAVAEIIAALEQESGQQIELIQPAQDEVFDKAQVALAAGRPPDFLYGTDVSWELWAHEDQLADLAGTLSPVLKLFDADIFEASTLAQRQDGPARALCPADGPTVQPYGAS